MIAAIRRGPGGFHRLPDDGLASIALILASDMNGRQLRAISPTTVAFLLVLPLSAVYLIWQPPSADLSAHLYRAWLFDHEGFSIWNNSWYSGHHTVSYSLLVPPLAATVGVRLLGTLCLLATSLLFATLLRGDNSRPAQIAAGWFTVGAFAMLLSGRIPFLLGTAVGLLTVLALKHGRLALAFSAAVLCGLTSPVSALFLALTATAYGVSGIQLRRSPFALKVCNRAKVHRGAALTLAALLPPLALAVLFPEGGTEPFVPSAFLPIPLLTVVALLAVPSSWSTVRIAVVLYGLGCLVAFLLPTPVGGNVVRLGALASGPVLVYVSRPASRRLLALAVLPLLWWQLYPAVRDISSATGDPATEAGYYTPLLRYLASRPNAARERIEIPATYNHWEAYHAGSKVPLARGWQRQLDRKYNPVFYEGPLTASRYRSWLVENGVSLVAVPDARVDYSAREEVALVRSGLPYLKEVWSSDHWRVLAVTAPRISLTDGATELTQLGSDRFELRAVRPGRTVVKVRFTPYWELPQGIKGCIERADGEWTAVELSEGAESLVVKARLSPAGLGQPQRRCFA